MSEWQPIDSAPKDGTAILAGWVSDGHREIVSWDGRQWFGQMSGYWKEKDAPRLWWPLPAPPTAKDSGPSTARGKANLETPMEV